MIFIHNSIPHNHVYENHEGCNEAVHQSTATSGHHSDLSVELISEPEETTVCHLSGFMFYNFNPDNLTVYSVKEIVHPIETTVQLLSTSFSQLYIPDHNYGSTSFRAPPVA